MYWEPLDSQNAYLFFQGSLDEVGFFGITSIRSYNLFANPTQINMLKCCPQYACQKWMLELPRIRFSRGKLMMACFAAPQQVDL